MVVVAIAGWATGARVLRSQTQSLRSRDFVTAAVFSGERPVRIVFREILPNMTSLIVGNFFGAATAAILAEAGLEFLGLGDSTVVSWGTMLFWAQNSNALLTGQWVLLSPPASASRCWPPPSPSSTSASTASATRASGNEVMTLLEAPTSRCPTGRRAAPPRPCDVSFRLAHGEFVGLVGESGLGQVHPRLRPHRALQAAGAHREGPRILFGGKDIASLDGEQLRGQRHDGIAMVLQWDERAQPGAQHSAAYFVDIFRAHAPRRPPGGGPAGDQAPS